MKHCAGIVALLLGIAAPAASSPSQVERRSQIVFQSGQVGYCPQDGDDDAPKCSDTSVCISTPAPGLCWVQTAQGFPLCGCCPDDTIACSSCGGDAQTPGQCWGIGPDNSTTQYAGCNCTSDGGDSGSSAVAVLPPAVLPIGFAVPPGGTPENTQECREPFLQACSDCDAKNAWCQTGDAAGCPCREDCKTGDDMVECTEDYCRGENNDGTMRCTVGAQIACECKGDPICPTDQEQPTCSDKTCAGNDDNKCTLSPYKDCECTPDDCPDGLDVPDCKDCGGSTDGFLQSTCKGKEDGSLANCACFQNYFDNNDTETITTSQVKAALDAFKSLPALDGTKNTTDVENGTLSCTTDTASAVPSELAETDANKTPNEILYTFREMLCNNKCEQPADLPDGTGWKVANNTADNCEVSVMIQNEVEVFMFRGANAAGDLQQQCWDNMQNIIDNCVNNGPNTGVVDGFDDGQYYKGGFRPLNDNSKMHSWMSGNELLPPQSDWSCDWCQGTSDRRIGQWCADTKSCKCSMQTWTNGAWSISCK